MTEIETTQPKKAKKSKASGPVPKTFERDLEVSLTDAERLKRNEDLLEAMQARDDLKSQKSEATSQINASIKISEGRVKDLAIALRSGKEKRPVRCTERFLFETNTVEIVRADTGAVIEKRAMTPEERTPTLPGLSLELPPLPNAPAIIAATIAHAKRSIAQGPLTATVGEIAKKRGRKPMLQAIQDGDLAAARCEKVVAGDRCVRPKSHRGTHGYKQGPKAN